MIFFPPKNKYRRQKAFYSRGMTYVELIVVLSIFAIITAISLFNYRKFEEKVDMKSLANDIALRIVEAQKSATSGLLLPSPKVVQAPATSATWKPSYGVWFNTTTNNKKFNFFVDLNQDKRQSGSHLLCSLANIDCTKQITIPSNSKSAIFASLQAYYVNPNIPMTTHSDLHITFTRPDSVATFYSANAFSAASPVLYVQINLSSPQGVTSNIKVYASGRIQIN